MTEHKINSEVKIGVLKGPIFFSFQCCLTWLLAYPVLAVLTFMVLPFHYRYKVSTTERISFERKCLLLLLSQNLNSVRVFSVKILKGPKKHNKLNTAYQWGTNFLIFAFIISGYDMGLIDCTVHINLIIIQTVLIKESILGSIFPCNQHPPSPHGQRIWHKDLQLGYQDCQNTQTYCRKLNYSVFTIKVVWTIFNAIWIREFFFFSKIEMFPEKGKM